MLRSALLFFLLLGFASAEIHASTATVTANRPIHRRKPMAGNYRPVYRYYRGSGSNSKGLFGGLFKKRQKTTSRHSTASKSRAHRTM